MYSFTYSVIGIKIPKYTYA